MRIAIGGCGTLGGLLAEHLVRLNHKRLILIDRDRVEARNLANQPYHHSDLGRPKARALADLLYRIAPDVEIDVHGQEFRSSHLRSADLVVDAFDNHLARHAIAQTSLPCLHIGISRDGFGEITWQRYYQVPPDEPAAEEQPCLQPTSRALSLLVAVAAGRAIEGFILNRSEWCYTVTEKDLTIARAWTALR